MQVTKFVNVDIDVDVDIDINLKDVLEFISEADKEELAAIGAALYLEKAADFYQPSTIMEDLAYKELQAILKLKGADYVLGCLEKV